MKNSTTPRRSLSARPGSASLRLKATALAAALGCGAMAQAQQAADTPQSVTVTGIRRGIETAISVKKNSDSIVESISAEDIGKLPDSSIAESIARLPGLAAQRVGGRAQSINIRGLSGDFAGTLLNGREQVSTGDNRAVEFDQYPSELLSGVDIYKTPDGALVGQGLSGTVNMKTVRPLDFGGRVVAFNLRGEKNSMGKLNPDSDDKGSRFSVSYVDQFADRTIGVALGYARLDSPSQAQRFEAWGYTGDDTAKAANGGKDVRVLGGFKANVDSTNQTRDGLMGVFQYRPSKNFESIVDAYYSKFDKVQKTRGFEVGLPWGGAKLSNPKIENDVLVGGTFSDIKPVLRNDLNKRTDELSALGWNNKLQMGGWTGVLDLSFSKAEKKESILETYAGIATRDSATFSFDNATGLATLKPSFNYADPAVVRLVDSGGWGQDGYIKWLNVTDELKAMRLSAQKDIGGFFGKLDFGVHYAEREKTKEVPEAFVDLKGSVRNSSGFTSTPTIVPSGLLVSPVSAGFIGFGNILAYDVQSAYDSVYKVTTKLHPDIFNKNWSVTEKVTTLYGKLDIDTEMGEVPIRGNVGLQYIHTDQHSTAFALANGNINNPPNYTAGTSYNDVLPSLNLSAEFKGDQKLRFGAAKQLARPRLDWLRASRNYSYDNAKNIFTGDGGNPFVEPFRANAFDLSYEKYFGTKAYVSVAAFTKKLKTYVYEQTLVADYSGLVNPNTGQVTPPGTLGTFKGPFNGTGGKIEGFELAVSTPLNVFTSALDGFGVIASYSDTRSGIKPQGPGTSLPLPGLSRRVSNLTAYYEKAGFSARVSQVSRSSFVGEITGFGADRDLVYIKPEKITDLQLGYEFGPGMLKGLSLLFQVNNLTNEPYARYDGTPDVPKEYVKYGRTYLFGLNYKL